MIPGYDWHQTYDWNYEHAPDPVPQDEPAVPGQWDYCGLPVDSPLGIAAGPLLNGQWTMQEAARLAGKLESTPDEGELIRKAWLAIYSRPPREDEVKSVKAFLERQTAELGAKKAATAELIRVLFNTNEFLYVD